MEYYIIINGEKSGPHALGQLKMLGVGPDTYVWCQGMPDWAFAKDVAEVAAVIIPARPNVPPTPQAPKQTYQQPYQQQPYQQQQQYQQPRQQTFQQPQQQYQQPAGVDKAASFNWIPLSIIATVLGSMIYLVGGIPGAIGIAKAVTARKAFNVGDYATAAANNRVAMILSIVSGGIFAVFFTIILIAVS